MLFPASCIKENSLLSTGVVLHNKSILFAVQDEVISCIYTGEEKDGIKFTTV